MHSRWTTLLFHSFFLCLLLWIELFGHETQVNSFGFGQGPHGLKQNHPSNSLEPPSASTQIREGLEFGPRITVISNTQEYLDFLAQDDRLCVIKWVPFFSCLWGVVLDKNDDGNEMHHEKLETEYDHQSSSFLFFCISFHFSHSFPSK